VLVAEMLLALIRAAILNQRERDDPERSVTLVVDLFLHGLRRSRVVAPRHPTRPRRIVAGGRR
jgi:hypothetical protein